MYLSLRKCIHKRKPAQYNYIEYILVETKIALEGLYPWTRLNYLMAFHNIFAINHLLFKKSIEFPRSIDVNFLNSQMPKSS